MDKGVAKALGFPFFLVTGRLSACIGLARDHTRAPLLRLPQSCASGTYYVVPMSRLSNPPVLGMKRDPPALLVGCHLGSSGSHRLRTADNLDFFAALEGILMIQLVACKEKVTRRRWSSCR